MKHAGAAALDALEPLLARVRGLGGLRERSRGIFYRGSRAFLHFHEDPSGLYADIRTLDGDDFDRIRLDSPEAEATVVARAQSRLGRL